jgi:hypothetical protein
MLAEIHIGVHVKFSLSLSGFILLFSFRLPHHIVLHVNADISELYAASMFRIKMTDLYPLTLKMHAVCSSKISVSACKTTRCHYPEGHSLHNHCRKNLQTYIKCVDHFSKSP